MRNSFRDTHFKIWKSRVEQYVGFSLDDLPDEPYRIWFEETSFSPTEVANIIKQHNMLTIQ